MSKFPYKALDHFVLRAPSKSLTFLKIFLRNKKISDIELLKICSEPFFQEALFLASPNLHQSLKVWLERKEDNKVRDEKIKLSILKYICRMSTRCTPFGLFAGYNIGTFKNENSISVNEISTYRRSTRLDMQYLVTLSQNFLKDKKIRGKLKFKSNSSLYKAGNQYRYIEYTYLNDLKRIYHIEAIESDKYFKYIIDNSIEGNTITQLANDLINFDSEINVSEAKDYINALIDNQILVSEIDPVIIGEDYFKIIKKKIILKDIVKVLQDINDELSSIDKKFGNSVDRYYRIRSIADNLNTDINLKYFFQTDLKINTHKNFLDKKILKDIKEGIIFLNKLSILSKNYSETHIDNFIKKFKARYDRQCIPLSKVLDPESGIGYKNNDMSIIIPDNNFIDNLIIPQQSDSKNEINWSNVNGILHYKITQAYKNGDYIIRFNSNDLPAWITETWNDLPDTLSFMTEIVNINGEQKIKLDGAGGASGSDLFGRFCLNDDELFNHTKDIIDIEKKINPNLVIAELSHLPESRIGNVISRPSFCEYEIPYLAQSIKTTDKQILIDDLMLSVKGNEIILFSKKLNKRILPRLINAHNYSFNSIPIYNFLCDLQNQNKRSGLNLRLGAMEKNYKFIPRIELGNLILKPATWNLRKKDLEIFTIKTDSDDDLLEAAQRTRTTWKMPPYIVLAENDNELFINLQNIDSIRMMINAIGEKANFIFKEFLFTDDEQLVRKNQEFYTNQIIITYYNNQKLSTIKND